MEDFKFFFHPLPRKCTFNWKENQIYFLPRSATYNPVTPRLSPSFQGLYFLTGGMFVISKVLSRKAQHSLIYLITSSASTILTQGMVGFPDGSDGKRICLQCRRPGFNPWVGKIHIHVQSLVMFICIDFFFFLNTRDVVHLISISQFFHSVFFFRSIHIHIWFIPDDC